MQRRELLKLSALLLGTAASASLSRAVLAGAGTASKTTTSPFTKAQQQSIRLLSDMIIPPTDTPGAVEAGVPAFINSIYADWYTDAERKIFSDGLAALDAFCIKQEKKSFDTASAEARLAALRDQESIASQYKSPLGAGSPFKQADDENAPFFKKIKELVVLGYYTSEVGATQELAYLPMPGYYDGNYDYAKAGRPWSN